MFDNLPQNTFVTLGAEECSKAHRSHKVHKVEVYHHLVLHMSLEFQSAVRSEKQHLLTWACKQSKHVYYSRLVLAVTLFCWIWNTSTLVSPLVNSKFVPSWMMCAEYDWQSLNSDKYSTLHRIASIITCSFHYILYDNLSSRHERCFTYRKFINITELISFYVRAATVTIEVQLLLLSRMNLQWIWVGCHLQVDYRD